MKKFELLAPAGSMEAAIAAIQNGCDALYLGGPNFGARSFATNFNDEEMQAVLAYAHQYGVSVFVTMNTIVYEDEISDALAYAKKLYLYGVDALIVQDLGLLTLLHQQLPDLQLHASTQMHIHNVFGIEQLKELGVKRVVLPRETPLEQIRYLCTQGVDVEVFIQGALCISYSGQCLMSALDSGRSGNRGACAQNCRMRYSLYNDTQSKMVETQDEYLLSPKDLCTIEDIVQLMECGVHSFKIEGRMKRPEYVAHMVKSYRKAIDLSKTKISFKEDIDAMKTLFYRGYTRGLTFQSQGKQWISTFRPNHLGILVGTVSYQKGKRVGIQLTDSLSQFDGIRFIQKEDTGGIVQKMYKDGLLINRASKGDFIEVDFYEQVTIGALVHKTSDFEQLKELKKSYEKGSRKVNVYMQIMLFHNQKVSLKLFDEDNIFVEVSSDLIVTKSDGEGLTTSRIEEQLRKSGATIYEVKEVEIYSDMNISFAIKDLNALRRLAFEELQKRRENRYPDRKLNDVEILKPVEKKQEKKFQWSAIIQNEEQYLGLKDSEVSFIYCNSFTLYERLKEDVRIRLRTPRVNYNNVIDEKALIQEIGGLHVKEFVVDTSIPCVNSFCATYLQNKGAKEIIASLELDDERLFSLVQQSSINFGIYIYSYDEVMTMDYCPVNSTILDNGKRNCSLCKQNRYSLIGKHGDSYLLQGDEECRMHIYRKLSDNRHRMNFYKELGIYSYYVYLMYENKDDVVKLAKEMDVNYYNK